MESNRKKTLLVGLDAACWEYLNPLLEAGQLPTIQRLVEGGAWGSLRSTLPASTPIAWSSIVTGKNPGKHGVFDFVWRKPGAYEFSPVSARRRQGTPVWKRLNEAGVRVGLVNVPFTYPPDEVDGFVVGGFGVPSSVPDITHPREVLSWIEERFGPYIPQVDVGKLKKSSPPQILAAEREHQERQVQIAAGLAGEYGVEVLMINLMLLDHANHYMPNMDLVNEAIIHSDAHLAILIEKFQPENILLISDHGSRRVHGDFLLQVWLQEHGYSAQAMRSRQDQARALNWALRQWLKTRLGWTGLPERTARNLVKTVLPRLPEGARQRFWNAVEQDLPRARTFVAYSTKFDTHKTCVFPGSQYNGLLYLNVAGRDANGVVGGEAERRALIEELKGKLMQVVDPKNGQKIFSGVWAAEDIYSGPNTSFAPDLILDSYDAHCGVLMANYQYKAGEKLRDRYFIDNRGDFGWHSRDGVFVFSGPGFLTGLKDGGRNVMDLPATLLYLYDIPMPEDFDGVPMLETLQPQYVQSHPVSYGAGDALSDVIIDQQYSVDESEELLNHLRALGYVE